MSVFQVSFSYGERGNEIRQFILICSLIINISTLNKWWLFFSFLKKKVFRPPSPPPPDDEDSKAAESFASNAEDESGKSWLKMYEFVTPITQCNKTKLLLNLCKLNFLFKGANFFVFVLNLMFSISDDDVVGSSPSTRKKNVYASDEESASEDEKSDGRFIYLPTDSCN